MFFKSCKYCTDYCLLLHLFQRKVFLEVSVQNRKLFEPYRLGIYWTLSRILLCLGLNHCMFTFTPSGTGLHRCPVLAPVLPPFLTNINIWTDNLGFWDTWILFVSIAPSSPKHLPLGGLSPTRMLFHHRPALLQFSTQNWLLNPKIVFSEQNMLGSSHTPSPYIILEGCR